MRGLSHLTWDDPPHRVRWRLGDDFQGSGALGGHTLLGGLTFGREYSLAPYYRGAPGLGLSGAVSTPATVDVYVNDALVRSERLPAGGFTLANLPVTTGAGVVRYEVRDALGQQQRFDAIYYLAPGLLARGEHDFRYTVGVPRLDFDTTSARYAGRQPAAVARHRVGLTDDVTLGAGLEANQDGITGGPTLSLGLPVGGVQLAVFGSRVDDAAGVAGLLGYSYRGRVMAAALSLQGATPAYAHLGLKPDEDRRLIEAAGQLSVTLGATAAGLQQRVAQRRDRGLSQESMVHLGHRLLRGVSVPISGARTHAAPELPPVYSAYASVGGTFDFGLSGRMGSQADDGGRRQVDVGLTRALPRREGLGFDAQATFDRDTATQASATGRAHGTPGRLLARYLRGPTGEHTVVEVNGGVAWVRGGGVHLTQPVQQAFGVVTVPELPNVEVRLDNNPVATTDSEGRAFLPHLRPYQANRISVNARALPMDRRIDRAEHRVAPPWRGGALVVMAITRALFVRGQLLMRGPHPDHLVRYGRLTLRVGDRSAASPVGEDGAFEFGELAPGRYPGILRAADSSRCMLEVTVPDRDGPIIDLGTVECVEVPSARPTAVAHRGRS